MVLLPHCSTFYISLPCHHYFSQPWFSNIKSTFNDQAIYTLYILTQATKISKLLDIDNQKSSGSRSNHWSFLATVLLRMVQNCRTTLIRQLQLLYIYILNSVHGSTDQMTSLSLCGRHFKGKGKGGFGARETWGKEGGKCLPGDYCFVHYKHPPGECWNRSLLPCALFAFLSRPQPLSLSFQMPATKTRHHWISSLLPSCPGSISQQSKQ